MRGDGATASRSGKSPHPGPSGRPSPARGRGEGKKKRKPYRRDASAKLVAIEERRTRAGITQHQLFSRAGIARATYQRAVRDGLMFDRHINALMLALRELEKEKGRARAWQL